jgi:hypothetical protein
MINAFRLNSVPEEGVLVAVVDDCSSARNAPRLGGGVPIFLRDEQISIREHHQQTLDIPPRCYKDISLVLWQDRQCFL